MKNGLILGAVILSLIAFIYFSSEEEVQNKKLTKKEIQEDKYWFVDLTLESDDEKISLLSILKNTSKDSINLILRDYLLSAEKDSIPYAKVINKIAKKYNLTNHKVASIVFSYKYEMLTKEDITNEFIDNATEN